MSTQLVPVARFWYPSEAHIARSYLQDHGILSFVFDDHLSSAAWHLTGALDGVRLMVTEADYQEAVSLLEQVNEIEVELIGSHYNNPVKPTLWDNIISFIISFLSGVPTLWHRTKRKKRE